MWYYIVTMERNIIKKTNRIVIIDTTLKSLIHRNYRLSHEDRLNLAVKLAATGVDELEAGIPAIGKWEQRFFKRLIARKLSVKISGWCRLALKDFETAYGCGLRHIRVNLPVSPASLDESGMTGEQMIERFRGLMFQWRGQFSSVSLELDDAFHGDPSVLEQLCKVSRRMRITTIRVLDSYGTAGAVGISSLISELSKLFDSELDFQGFNNPGLALDNFMSALDAGAQTLSLRVNPHKTDSRGAALMDMILALKAVPRFTSSVNPNAIPSVSEFMDSVVDLKVG